MRTRLLLVFAALAALAVVVLRGAPARPPDVVLLVLDTVRADHTSLCGYGRPTTPTLVRLRQEGFAASCGAVSPGTWTLPSHAAYFTGRSVLALRGGAVPAEPADTLAGAFQARGYRTALVSANPVLGSPRWLHLGFDAVTVAKGFRELQGARLADAVDRALADIPADTPAFVVVNVIDAHAPYPAIPEGVGWVEPQRPVNHRMFAADPSTPFNRYVTGRMAPGEADEYRARLRDGYDWAVSRADDTLAQVIAALDRRGRWRGARVVITSDHGEFVGEHGQVGHGDTLYEPGVRVPFLYRPSDGPALALPEPMSAGALTALLRDGALPPPSPVFAAVWRQERPRESWNGLALWADAGDKLLWRDEVWERYDLASDPGEERPAPLGEHPARASLERLVAEDRAAMAAAPPLDADTVEALRALGYVE